MFVLVPKLLFSSFYTNVGDPSFRQSLPRRGKPGDADKCAGSGFGRTECRTKSEPQGNLEKLVSFMPFDFAQESV